MRSDAEAFQPAAPRVLVTGCAGFIGSHLSERLLELGHEVVGVDCFTDYYPRPLKEANLAKALKAPRFRFLELDLSTDSLDGLLDGVDTVYHLAAQAGVRASFGEGFAGYIRHNIRATQRLLEAAVVCPVRSFTYASSSSVYGNADSYPTTESTERRPVSPYGMTKVATEELAAVYLRNFEVPVVGLRYFTVYGPRQRPDMAFTRFLGRVLDDEPVTVFGDGRQVRDFTYVGDIVEGTIAASRRGTHGVAYNIGGGSPLQLREALALIEEVVGRPVRVQRSDAMVGDARRTGCDGWLAVRDFGFAASTGLREGLTHHLSWLQETRESSRQTLRKAA